MVRLGDPKYSDLGSLAPLLVFLLNLLLLLPRSLVTILFLNTPHSCGYIVLILLV